MDYLCSRGRCPLLSVDLSLISILSELDSTQLDSRPLCLSLSVLSSSSSALSLPLLLSSRAPSSSAMKRFSAVIAGVAAAVLALSSVSGAEAALNTVTVDGSQLVDSVTGQRFFVRGMGYDYTVRRAIEHSPTYACTHLYARACAAIKATASVLESPC